MQLQAYLSFEQTIIENQAGNTSNANTSVDKYEGSAKTDLMFQFDNVVINMKDKCLLGSMRTQNTSMRVLIP